MHKHFLFFGFLLSQLIIVGSGVQASRTTIPGLDQQNTVPEMRSNRHRNRDHARR